MRIGVSAGQSGQLARPAALSAVAKAAEQLGYSSVWVRDDADLDPVVVLSTVAAVTSRARLGASFDVAPPRSAAALARALVSLDVLSDGRLSVSLGPGAAGDLDETLDVLESTWPGTRPRPPLLLVADAPSQLDRVARRADGWNPGGLPLDRLGSMWAELRDLAAAHRRHPDALQLVVRADVFLTDRAVGGGDRRIYHGTVEQVADDVDATRRLGAHEVVLGVAGDPSLDQLLDAYARVAEAADVRAAAA